MPQKEGSRALRGHMSVTTYESNAAWVWQPVLHYRWMPLSMMLELIFEVVQEEDGGYCAECLTENIFTEGDTWEHLRNHVLEATSAFFFDRPRPERIRLYLVRDEILSVA